MFFCINIVVHCVGVEPGGAHVSFGYPISSRLCLLTNISTPLKCDAWARCLSAHPDKEFVAYILQGINSGFHIGFDRKSSKRVKHIRLKGVGKGGGGAGGAEVPQILSSCYYVYKHLPQKDVQNLEKQERKNQVSGYKQNFPSASKSVIE